MRNTLSAAAAAIALLLAHGACAAGAPLDTSPCDRGCLTALAEQYLAAMRAHDPRAVPLARNIRYTENGVELPLPDGLWRTLSALGRYRLYVADPQQRAIGFFAKAEENGAPVLVATRLRVIDHEITEIESVVARLSSTQGGQVFPGARDLLGDTPRAQFLATLPQGVRRTRAQLADIVNGYFSGIENNTGDRPPAFADDCRRLENGSQTTGLAVPAGAQPGPANYGCKEAFALGYYHEDTRLRDRRVLAVDEERGLVYAAVFLDHDAAVRSYSLKDGRTVKVRNTAPWTWQAQELFQIDADGHISQVEAVLVSAPYGLRPGWTTGVHLQSPQAQLDHFREY